MLHFLVTLQNLVTDRVADVRRSQEEGATAVEYGLMVALIAAAIIVTVTALGGRLNGLFASVRDALPGGAPANP